MCELSITRGIAFFCDDHGLVVKIIRDDLGVGDAILPGSSFLQWIDSIDREGAAQFLLALQNQQAVFDYELSLRVQDRLIPLHFAGGPANGGFLVMGRAVSTPQPLAPEPIQDSRDMAALVAENRQIKEALKVSNTFYHALFESATDAIFVVQGELFVDCNERSLVTFGGRREEIVGKTFWQHSPVTQPDGQNSRAKGNELVRGALVGVPQVFEWRHYRLDGRIMETEVSLHKVAESDPPTFLAVVRDITERKQAQEALVREKQLIDAVFDSVPGLLYLFDEQGRMVRWNKRLEAITGYSAEEIKEMPVLDWFVVGDRPHVEKAVSQVFNQGFGAVEANLLCQDGRRIPYYFSAIKLTREGRNFLTGIGLDITERKKIEKALAREKRFIDAVFDSMPGLIFLYDDQGHLIRWNTQLEVAMEYSAEELKGKYFLDWFAVEDWPRIREVFARVLSQGGGSVEVDTIIKSGIRIPYYYQGVCLTIDGRNYLTGIGLDITEVKRTEAALKEAKEVAEAANHAKDQFIAVLSHELRTPLTPVLATVSALREQEELPGEVRDDLEVIRRNVELEVQLIDDLLDVTRLSRGKLDLRQEVVDVHDCLRSVVEICRVEIEAMHQAVIIDFQADRSHVWGDPARLRQIFWNLLKNAVKFTPKEGRITLHTFNEGERVKIEVADTGIGIAPDLIARIFDPFEQSERTRTRRFGGLGLGLSIAKVLVERHLGKLTVFSEGLEKGAVFTVDLGSVAALPVSLALADVSLPDVLLSRRILLVEDHADTRRILARLLQKEGGEVTTADSVRSALKCAEARKFDLLLSDLGLPDGSGLEVMREVKARYGLRGIALSGFGTEEDVRASREAGFEEHLTKPLDFTVLRAAVQRLIRPKNGS